MTLWVTAPVPARVAVFRNSLRSTAWRCSCERLVRRGIKTPFNRYLMANDFSRCDVSLERSRRLRWVLATTRARIYTTKFQLCCKWLFVCDKKRSSSSNRQRSPVAPHQQVCATGRFAPHGYEPLAPGRMRVMASITVAPRRQGERAVSIVPVEARERSTGSRTARESRDCNAQTPSRQPCWDAHTLSHPYPAPRKLTLEIPDVALTARLWISLNASILNRPRHTNGAQLHNPASVT